VNSLESLMSWVVKLIFILLLLPFAVSLIVQLFSLAYQAVLGVFFVVLPWVVGLLVIIALVAGITAGITMRRYIRPTSGNAVPPGVSAIKRPRGRGREEGD